MSGDDDPYDDELTCFAYVEASEDLDKAFILTGGDGNARDGAGLEKTLGGAGIPDSLGGYGTVAGGIVSPFTNVAVRAGIKMLYAGVSFKPRENLNIDLLYAYAKADEVWDTNVYLSAIMGAAQGPVDDVMGSEYDLTVTWDIFDNLEYKFVAAYLQAGDFWKQGFDVEIDDTYTLFNKLTLSF
jgi:hypothetical protein